MDLIDRDALLEQIDIDSDGNEGQYGDGWQFIKTIENAPTIEAPTWIPCSERLPEDPNPSFTYANKTYQVTTASGEVVALKWQKTEVRGKTVMRWEWSSGVIYHGDALAWKPLSEPWEGVDDEWLDI